MPDKGGWVNHMSHSEKTAFDENGILYDHSFTRLRTSSLQLGYAFPSSSSGFFFCIYVKPMYSADQATTQLIFAKRTAVGVPYLELWIKNSGTTGDLVVVTAAKTVTLTGYFTYDLWVRVGVHYALGMYRVYWNNSGSVYISDTNNDVANKVWRHLRIE